jgi:hypothetical protein
MAAMTRDELLEVVYRFNPRGMHEFSSGYDATEEAHRRLDAARRGVAEAPRWKAMLRRLRVRYELDEQSWNLLSGRYDPGYSADIFLPGRKLGMYVSVVGPYYAIHHAGAPGEEEVVLDLAQEIEASFPGYQGIPPELGNEVVPDVGNFGKTTIYHCLLSEVWDYSSGPYDDAKSPTYVERGTAADDDEPPLSDADTIPQPAPVRLPAGQKVLRRGDDPPPDDDREPAEPRNVGADRRS